MKEMEYGKTTPEVLHEGTHHGYNFLIGSLGSHPVAYVEIPETHPCYKTPCEKIYINCHYGLTYGGTGLRNFGKEAGRWIGWDYAHCSDYAEFPGGFSMGEKRWTTAEIMEEVDHVIYQLHGMEGIRHG